MCVCVCVCVRVPTIGSSRHVISSSACVRVGGVGVCSVPVISTSPVGGVRSRIVTMILVFITTSWEGEREREVRREREREERGEREEGTGEGKREADGVGSHRAVDKTYQLQADTFRQYVHIHRVCMDRVHFHKIHGRVLHDSHPVVLPNEA